MDLFSLLSFETLPSPQVLSDISLFQRLFDGFQALLDQLLASLEYPLNIVPPLMSLFSNNPQITLKMAPYLQKYYQERLDQAIFEGLEPKMANLGLTEQSGLIGRLYRTNMKLLGDFQALVFGSEGVKSCENMLKERITVIFIENKAFQAEIEAFLASELLFSQQKMLEMLAGKLEEGFLGRVQGLLEGKRLIKGGNSAIYEEICYFCSHFGFASGLETLVFGLLRSNLQQFIAQFICQGLDFEDCGLWTELLSYSQAFLMPYLHGFKALWGEERLKAASERLEAAISNEFFMVCKEKAFDMILAYPESANLIYDLKKAIGINSNLLFELSDSILNAIHKRLLIPGVITQSILNQYINILKVLQLIDQGLIFGKVTAPIKAYLLKRPDTLRCIIAHLTEDSENYNKLVKEYIKIPEKEEQPLEVSSEDDEQEAEKWDIYPLMSYKHATIRVKYQESDLVSVLVNLYGSREAFLNEYQVMLAEKLLDLRELNIEEEVKNIELLKLRFGENNLQNCNILVKDVKESRRIDLNLHEKFDQRGKKDQWLGFEKLHVLFASKGYWPINYDLEPLKLPQGITQVFEDYADKFSKIKAMRKLVWHTQLGAVSLSLSFDNGEFEFKCLPIHAVLISYFDETKCNEKIGVSAEFIAKDLNLPTSTVKRKMAFWVHKKVVREYKNLSLLKSHYNLDRPGLKKGLLSAPNPGFFTYLDPEADNVIYFPMRRYDPPPSDENPLQGFEDAEERTGILLRDACTSDFEATQFNNMIEGLIVSMLTTNGPKAAEKIYNLLKTVYKTNVSYPYNEVQTREILKSMLVKQKIAFNGELYSAVN